ncbi:hypothetical protein C0J52_18875 [Blattella germanica]|nr:hypothetical protein C0J52_18875 [Blattella germanica]
MLLHCCNGRTNGNRQNEGRTLRELGQLKDILVVCCQQGIRCFRYCCCHFQERIPHWCCHLHCSCYCLRSHCFASRLVLVVVVLVHFHCCCCHYQERIPHWCYRLHCFYCCLHFHCFLLGSCLGLPNRRCRIWNSKREVKDRPCSMLLRCCNGRTSGHHQNEGRIRRELDQLMGILVVCCLQGIRCFRYCCCRYQEQIPRWCCHLRCSCYCLHSHCFASRLVLVVVVLVRFHCCCCHFRERIPHWCCRLHCFYCCLHFHCFLLDSCLDPPNRRCRIWNSKREVKDRPCSMLLHCCNGRTSGHHQNEGRIRRELDQLMGILVVCCLQGIRCSRYCYYHFQEQIPRWCCRLHCSCCCLHYHRHHLHCFHLFLERNLRLLAGHK